MIVILLSTAELVFSHNIVYIHFYSQFLQHCNHCDAVAVLFSQCVHFYVKLVQYVKYNCINYFLYVHVFENLASAQIINYSNHFGRPYGHIIYPGTCMSPMVKTYNKALLVQYTFCGQM